MTIGRKLSSITLPYKRAIHIIQNKGKRARWICCWSVCIYLSNVMMEHLSRSVCLLESQESIHCFLLQRMIKCFLKMGKDGKLSCKAPKAQPNYQIFRPYSSTLVCYCLHMNMANMEGSIPSKGLRLSLALLLILLIVRPTGSGIARLIPPPLGYRKCSPLFLQDQTFFSPCIAI